MSTPDLLTVFEEMSLLELKDFVDAFQDRFGVTAAAPMAMGMMAAAGGGAVAAPVEEEQDDFTVMLLEAGAEKIKVIKEVRTLTSLGLKEAKDLVDGAPKPVLEHVDKVVANKAKAQLEGAGAKVELK
jgi:large subunit ribosomal protein L7/L12